MYITYVGKEHIKETYSYIKYGYTIVISETPLA